MDIHESDWNALLDRFLQLVNIVDSNVQIIGAQAAKIKALEETAHEHTFPES